MDRIDRARLRTRQATNRWRLAWWSVVALLALACQEPADWRNDRAAAVATARGALVEADGAVGGAEDGPARAPEPVDREPEFESGPDAEVEDPTAIRAQARERFLERYSALAARSDYVVVATLASQTHFVRRAELGGRVYREVWTRATWAVDAVVSGLDDLPGELALEYPRHAHSLFDVAEGRTYMVRFRRDGDGRVSPVIEEPDIAVEVRGDRIETLGLGIDALEAMLR